MRADVLPIASAIAATVLLIALRSIILRFGRKNDPGISVLTKSRPSDANSEKDDFQSRATRRLPLRALNRPEPVAKAPGSETSDPVANGPGTETTSAEVNTAALKGETQDL
ncbi:MAG TPA: hypothetical protein VEZ90_06180 [Blastocatellia bacterium]|nr:hypothetical protein [Blastocatellia bacterium]